MSEIQKADSRFNGIREQILPTINKKQLYSLGIRLIATFPFTSGELQLQYLASPGARFLATALLNPEFFKFLSGKKHSPKGPITLENQLKKPSRTKVSYIERISLKAQSQSLAILAVSLFSDLPVIEIIRIIKVNETRLNTARKYAIRYLKRGYSLHELIELGFVNIKSYEDIPRNTKRESVLSTKRKYGKVAAFLRNKPEDVSNKQWLLTAKKIFNLSQYKIEKLRKLLGKELVPYQKKTTS